MDLFSLVFLLCVAYICFKFLTTSRHRRSSSGATLPPGPRGLPVIGNILELGEKPHVSLTDLAKKHGPVMSLRLGSVTAIVITSPEAAREVLQIHDHVLSNRTIPDALRIINHAKYSMGWLPATAQWRQLRKIASAEMLTTQSLNSTKTQRFDKVKSMLEYVRKSCSKGEAVDVGGTSFTTTMNLISTTLFSIDFAQYGEFREFKEVACGLMEEMGKPNPVDFFPFLRYILIPSLFRKRLIRYNTKLMRIFDRLIAERKRKRASAADYKDTNDVLDSLLKIIEEDNAYDFDESFLKHMLFDLFQAGTDTSANTVEWAMTELLLKPEKMAKAQAEIRQAVGDKGFVQESDIQKLPYLQAIVKEALRLHAPVPFLILRKADADVEVLGHVVPKDAQIWVNVWAIGRDPDVWSEAHLFEPERFLEHDMDVRGQSFELLPFGGGRRICPGIPLAHRMVHLMLGSLLYEFDWKLPNGLEAKDIDMSDTFGLTMHKAVPLQGVPIKV